MTSCPFCEVQGNRVFYESHLVIGLWDAFPIAPGHALLLTRWHVASWFDASPGERAELLDTVPVARKAIEERHSPDGYNIGVNVGEAAGQTIPHLHVHVIPRYTGDVTGSTRRRSVSNSREGELPRLRSSTDGPWKRPCQRRGRPPSTAFGTAP